MLKKLLIYLISKKFNIHLLKKLSKWVYRKHTSTLHCHLIPIRMVIIKKISTSVGKDAEGWKPSYTVGTNVNWCDHYGKQYGVSSKIKNRTYHMVQQFQFWVFFQRNENTIWKRCMHPYRHGEGTGKSLWYSCLEKPMNSLKSQKDRTLKDELPRSVGAQYATGDQWRNNSKNNEETEPKQKQYPVVDVTSDRRYNAVKRNIA